MRATSLPRPSQPNLEPGSPFAIDTGDRNRETRIESLIQQARRKISQLNLQVLSREAHIVEARQYVIDAEQYIKEWRDEVASLETFLALCVMERERSVERFTNPQWQKVIADTAALLHKSSTVPMPTRRTRSVLTKHFISKVLVRMRSQGRQSFTVSDLYPLLLEEDATVTKTSVYSMLYSIQATGRYLKKDPILRGSWRILPVAKVN